MNVKKLVAKIGDQLEADEAVTAAVKVTDTDVAASTILATAAAVAAENPALAVSNVDRTASATGGAMQGLLVVTDRRVAIVELSGLGRPKQIVTSVPRSVITGASMGETKLMGQKMPTVELTLSDGADVTLGVAKVHRSDGQAVVDALS